MFRRKISMTFVPLLCVILCTVSGCATSRLVGLNGYPDRPEPLKQKVSDLNQYIGKLSSEYEDQDDSAKKKTLRNEIVSARIRLIDTLYDEFLKSLRQEKMVFDIGADAAILTFSGLGGAGVIGTEVLAALSAGIIGFKGSADKNAYYEKTIFAIISTMESARKVQYASILDNFDAEIDDYPLNAALKNTDDYLRAGTIQGAIQKIIEDSGIAASIAEDETNDIINP